MGYENQAVFPLLIQHLTGTPEEKIKLIHSVQELPIRAAFRILKANATEEDLAMVNFLLL